jgi:hypothetical protein
MTDDTAALVGRELADELGEALGRIEHCLDQLTAARRPAPLTRVSPGAAVVPLTTLHVPRHAAGLPSPVGGPSPAMRP